MKTSSFFTSRLTSNLALAALALTACVAHAATFTNTPSSVSNTYSGNLTLQAGGLTNGETVVIQKFIDLNTNGVIDAGDWLVQQYRLIDGQAGMVIAGVTNINVPGDSTPVDGAITSPQSFVIAGIPQQMVGKYLYKLSSPTGRFTAVTNAFTVTNAAFAQSFTGSVKCSGTNVPNAGVLLFVPSPGGGMGSPVAGAMANNSGSYTIKTAPGTYLLFAFKNGFVTDVAAAPVLTLNSSVTITTNLSLLPATLTISGKTVDAANTNLGLAGIMAAWQSTNYLLAVGFTDTNGNFSSAVTASQWQWGGDDSGLVSHGYLDLNDQSRPALLTTTGSVANATVAFPRGTALFHGTVRDDQDHPLAGVQLYANPNDWTGPYSSAAKSDQNGNYVMAIDAAVWRAEIDSEDNPGFVNYIFSQGSNVTVTNGQAVQQNFVARLATNHISGYLKDNSSNPIGNVWIWASANINGTDYDTGADTDDTSYYSLNVANGTWTVGVSYGWDDDSLSTDYLPPPNQTVGITNQNKTVNFTAQLAPYHITGAVKDNNTNPVPNVTIYAYASINGTNYNLWLGTDGGGNYSFGVVNGTWHVGVGCGGLNALGYQCVSEQMTNISNANGTVNFTVQPFPPLQITTTSLPDGAVGDYYFQLLEASGGEPDYAWSLFSGTLPPGLTLDPSGELSGYPTNDGTFNFTVQVADDGSHTTNRLLSLTIAPAPRDVVRYYVMKLECFRQLDAATLVPDTNHGPFVAKLAIIQSDLNTVPIANVYLPGGAVRGFPPGGSGIELVIYDYYPSQAAFDAVYTNGNYTFAMATVNNGFQFPVLAMPVAVYPTNPTPRVSNYAAAQTINPASPFTLQWINPSDATTNDTIWAFIMDSNGNTVFSTPYPPTNYSTCLRGTATSVVVPTNTFQLGGAYTGVIGFFRATSVNTTAYPGALGLTLVGVMTDFPMAAPSAAAPVLSQPARISGTQFGFLLSGLQGQNYTVLASTNISLPLSNWFPVLTTNLSSNPAFIQDNQATNQWRFYRVKVGP